MKRAAPDPRAQARRAALNALRRARRAAVRAGVTLSDWEGEFLGSVEDRIKTFGRAFGDPEKGAAGQAWDARGIPTTLIIDRMGRERARAEGAADWASPAAAELIRKLVA